MSNPVATDHHEVYPAIDPRGNLKSTCSGKRICILGAAKGCGQAMAVSYAQAGAAQLFLTARSVVSLEDTKQAVAFANSCTHVLEYSLDLKNAVQAEQILQKILQVCLQN